MPRLAEYQVESNGVVGRRSTTRLLAHRYDTNSLVVTKKALHADAAIGRDSNAANSAMSSSSTGAGFAHSGPKLAVPVPLGLAMVASHPAAGSVRPASRWCRPGSGQEDSSRSPVDEFWSQPRQGMAGLCRICEPCTVDTADPLHRAGPAKCEVVPEGLKPSTAAL